MSYFAVRPTASQLEDLKTVCKLGRDKLRLIADALNKNATLLTATKVEQIIALETDERTAQISRRVLFGLATASRRTFTPVSDILQRTGVAIKQRWDEEAQKDFDSCTSELEALLNSAPIALTAKAIDLMVDFEKLYLNARVLTDIRPIFNDARTEIVGSAITQTLRLEYMTNDGESRELSFALDTKDLKQLEEECSKALHKTTVSKTLMNAVVPTLISGEDIDG